MVQVYYEKDADLTPLKNKRIAVIGYGSQGHAQAQNLHDSGLDVVVGIRRGKSWDKAKADGLKVLSVKDAAAEADVIQILVPDHIQSVIYKDDILPGLHLVFRMDLAFISSKSCHQKM